MAITEETLSELRCEADYWTTVYGVQKKILGSQALLELERRCEDLENTALKIEASMDAGEGGHIEMETAPLDTAKYLKEGDQAKINLVHGELLLLPLDMWDRH